MFVVGFIIFKLLLHYFMLKAIKKTYCWLNVKIAANRVTSKIYSSTKMLKLTQNPKYEEVEDSMKSKSKSKIYIYIYICL